MSIEWLPPKKLKRMERGYRCPICGTRYEDRQDAKKCRMECRRRLKQ